MLELIPDKLAACNDEAITFHLLIRITPPPPAPDRPNLNLSLVLDRSGSMKGPPMDLTLEAAALAVRWIQSNDVISIVLFNNEVETLVAQAGLADQAMILSRLSEVTATMGTALYDGWMEGVKQAEIGVRCKGVNRVVLLTDGEANEGEVDPVIICREVERAAHKGLQTTTLGFGEGYNEQLLRSMASSGEGNHFFVETPEQLVEVFLKEMSDLANTHGTRVRLRLESPHGSTVEWLADVDLGPGGVKMADLVSGAPLCQVVRLQLPPVAGAVTLKAVLSWHCPRQALEYTCTARTELPGVSAAERMALPAHPEVCAQVAVAVASRLRGAAMKALLEGLGPRAMELLQQAWRTPGLPDLERNAIQDLQRTIGRGDYSAGHKAAAMHGHGHGHGHGHARYVIPVGRFNLDHLAVRRGALFGTMPGGARRGPERAVAMLRGLFYGERLARGASGPMGEASRLALITLNSRRPFDLAQLAREFARAEYLMPSPSLRKLIHNLSAKLPWYRWGGTSASCAALRRIAPALVFHCLNPSTELWWEVAASTALTHNDNAALVGTLGYAGLLWDMLDMVGPPEPDWYFRRFMELTEGLEVEGVKYECQTASFRGWKGSLREFLAKVLPQARSQGKTLQQVIGSWGSGPYMLEFMPTLLYLLEHYADEPQEALRQATQDTLEADSLGAAMGAAMGALHGAHSDWQLEDDLEAALEQLSQRWHYLGRR